MGSRVQTWLGNAATLTELLFWTPDMIGSTPMERVLCFGKMADLELEMLSLCSAKPVSRLCLVYVNRTIWKVLMPHKEVTFPAVIWLFLSKYHSVPHFMCRRVEHWNTFNNMTRKVTWKLGVGNVSNVLYFKRELPIIVFLECYCNNLLSCQALKKK